LHPLTKAELGKAEALRIRDAALRSLHYGRGTLRQCKYVGSVAWCEVRAVQVMYNPEEPVNSAAWNYTTEDYRTYNADGPHTDIKIRGVDEVVCCPRT